MKSLRLFNTLLLSIFILPTSFANAEGICHVMRHAFYDVGSGSTKLTVLENSSCDKTPKTLLNTSEKVDYKDDLLKTKNSEFSEQIQIAGLEALKKLKAEAVKLNVDEHKGVATAAFREAKNASQMLDKVKKSLDIPIEVISQEREAQLAYQAVKLRESEPKILVWDIGGASFQITAYDLSKNEWNVFKGTLASVVFKDLVITKVKSKPDLITPNPMTKEEIKKARKLIIKELGEHFKKSFVTKKTFKKVIGVGGVLTQSVKRHLNKSVFTAQEIDLWIQQNHNKTDAELNDKYAITVTTNMILVSEMMKILKIKSVEALDVALVEGLLVPDSNQPK